MVKVHAEEVMLLPLGNRVVKQLAKSFVHLKILSMNFKNSQPMFTFLYFLFLFCFHHMVIISLVLFDSGNINCYNNNNNNNLNHRHGETFK